MNASSLLMVIKSRTFGMLCSVTFSAVSKAAAITGSAEFFAPLIATVPRSAFPPLIRNLSIPSLCAASVGAGLEPGPSDFSLHFLCHCVNHFLIPQAPFANLLLFPQLISSPREPPLLSSALPVPRAYCVPPPAERVPPQTLSSRSPPPEFAAPPPQLSHL